MFRFLLTLLYYQEFQKIVLASQEVATLDLEQQLPQVRGRNIKTNDNFNQGYIRFSNLTLLLGREVIEDNLYIPGEIIIHCIVIRFVGEWGMVTEGKKEKIIGDHLKIISRNMHAKIR